MQEKTATLALSLVKLVCELLEVPLSITVLIMLKHLEFIKMNTMWEATYFQ